VFELARRYIAPLQWMAGRAAATMRQGAEGHAWPSATRDQGWKMPKLKTKSGAKKRFSRTATGKIKMNVAHKRHRLISKPKQMKRKARGTVTLQPGDRHLVLTYMPYLRG
jgi:large subunit ribosomal protein L35